VAEIMQFNGMYSQAIRHYEKAISLDEDYFAGYTGIAEARMLGGDLDGALEALDQARQHAASDQQRANVKRLEANLYFFAGDGPAGLRTLKEAAASLEQVDANGPAALARQTLAAAEALYGGTENIPLHIAKAKELAPNSANNDAWAAIAYGIAGNADAARRAARAFEESSGGNEIARTFDGVVAVAAGRYADAERILMESGLDDPWAMAFMARTQHELGHATEALALESEIMADHEYTVVNFSYTLPRLMLVENGAGSVRAGVGSK
jgi:tetratricopeptide (TPR) repeat protein